VSSVEAAAGVRTKPVVIEESFATKFARGLGRAPIHLLLIFLGLVWLVPTFGLFITSISDVTVIGSGAWWKVFSHPSALTFSNYAHMFQNNGITSALIRTAEITAGATILPILIAAAAGYAFAWLEFPGRDWWFLIVVAMLVVPLQMALIPMFRLYNDTHLFDTIPGLILFHTAFALPFAIFLLRNFFIGIPKELMEAARIDGASEARIFFRLILPLGVPALASLAIFQVLFVWNDLLVGLTLAQDNVPINPLIASQLRQFGSNLDVIAPAAFFSLLIPLTIFAAFQRYFVQGLLAGSVK
jgi:alpha-glucoside transport system permease protein